MLPNAFIGKRDKPTEDELAAELGPSKTLWDRLVGDLAAESGVTAQEWNSYSPKAGWSLRLKKSERTIVYLVPCRGCFRAAFALGDKAVQAACRSKLPPKVITAIKGAKRYAEGTAVRIVVIRPGDLAVVKKIVAAKLENRKDRTSG